MSDKDESETLRCPGCGRESRVAAFRATLAEGAVVTELDGEEFRRSVGAPDFDPEESDAVGACPWCCLVIEDIETVDDDDLEELAEFVGGEASA